MSSSAKLSNKKNTSMSALSCPLTQYPYRDISGRLPYSRPQRKWHSVARKPKAQWQLNKEGRT